MTSPTGKILCIDNSGNVYPAMNTKFTDIQVTGNINVGPNQEVTLNEQTIETMPSLVVSHSTNPLLLSVIATGGTAGLLFGKTGSQSLSLNGDFTTAKCHITSMDQTNTKYKPKRTSISRTNNSTYQCRTRSNIFEIL